MTTVGSPAQSRFVTVAEAAQDLHVTERYIRKLIATGDLEAVKVGSRLVRIQRADIESLLRPVRAPYRPRRGTS